MLYGYFPSLLAGAWVTLQVALLSLLLALALGLAGASSRLSAHAALRMPATVYTTVVRGIPDLVMMLLVFYGGQMAVNLVTDALGWDYVDVNPFVAGVATLGFIFGAYFTETFRGAFLAVPAGQLEAGRTTREPFVFYLAVCVFYLALTAISGLALRWLESRYSVGVRKATA